MKVPRMAVYLGIVTGAWMVSTGLLYAGERPEDTADSSAAASLQYEVIQSPGLYDMVSNIPRDLGELGIEMSRKENYPLIAGVSLLTIGMHTVDSQVWTWTKPNFRKEEQSPLNNVLVGMGDGRTHFAVAGVFAAVGLLSDDHRALRTASQAAEALLTAGLVVQAIKHVTGRESPVAASGPAGEWKLFPNQREYLRHQTRYYSFPSGHTASTMALVTVIAENYPEYTWLKPAGFLAVGLVEIGLVNAGMHWYGDFPVAMLLGYACGMIAAGDGHFLHSGNLLDPSSDVSIQPVLTPVGSAVGFSLRF